MVGNWLVGGDMYGRVSLGESDKHAIKPHHNHILNAIIKQGYMEKKARADML